jgi:hypothetical protein
MPARALRTLLPAAACVAVLARISERDTLA